MGRKPTKYLNLPSGMRRRDKSSGKTYYYLDTGGKPRKEIPLGSDFIIALHKYADLVKTIKVAPVLFGQFINEWILRELPRRSRDSQRTTRNDLKYVIHAFKDAPLGDIKPLTIRQFMTQMRDIPSTANRCKALIHQIWNFGRESGYTQLPNPVEGVKSFKTKKRTFYVSNDLYGIVYASAHEPLQEAMDLAYLTGQRPGDLLDMTEADLREKSLFVVQNKTGASLRLELSRDIEAVLARIRKRKHRLQAKNGKLLVNLSGDPLTKSTLRWYVDQAREKAAERLPERAEEIRAMWFYDLRSKAADDTLEATGEMKSASRLLGHANEQMTRAHYIRRPQRVASILKIPVRKAKR